MGWQFWIDRGGTFTDIVAVRPDGSLVTSKLLSVDPGRYADAAIAGIRRHLKIGPDARIPDGSIDVVRMGTTVATNALLERKGDRTLLVVNRGFGDLLRIGDQTRRSLFDLDIARINPLYERVLEIAGRVGIDGTTIEELDRASVLQRLVDARRDGLQACAIALIHAWKYPDMERQVAALADEAGFPQVSMSHDTIASMRLVPRADTSVVDAYVSPILRRYVGHLARELPGVPLFFMQSHGGLAEASLFRGRDAVLSGPAGGLVGAARTAALEGIDQIIGFDMGGTSTDVCLYAGHFDHATDSEIAGIRIRTPMLAIKTVAAGGGSILAFDGARFKVGPHSAGADPGPACYRRGGPLTITDANVLLGKIQASHFPAIFGPNGDEPIDVAVVHARFDALAATIARDTGRAMDAPAVAEGFVAVAVANMAHAIKQISLHKGRDPSRFTLSCFGGAGGQHACLVADELGMDTILLHPMAGVLSAYGMGLADQSVWREQAVEAPFLPDALADLAALARSLEAAASDALRAQGVGTADLHCDAVVTLRYEGTEAVIPVPFGTYDAIVARFAAAHRRQFGFTIPGRRLVTESLRVQARADGASGAAHAMMAAAAVLPDAPEDTTIWSGGVARPAAVYDRARLGADHAAIAGPAIIREANATTIVEPGWSASVTDIGHLLLRRTQPRGAVIAEADLVADPVRLELFNNIFMSIAEQAGLVLQNTALSVNIKERLDFSCAIFDADGNLIANAPHVPVHLGAMSESVRLVKRSRGTSLKPGDVVALNDPYRGGTHLPDITVVTPVFDTDGTLLFFVGSRGHHADIGGSTPGSMPPDARRLEEEGVILDDMLLVGEGAFREAAFRERLASAAFPARNPDVNVADVKAQIASNTKAVEELLILIETSGRAMVQRYMRFVMDHAESSVRAVIDRLHDGAVVYDMDDGSPLAVAIRVDRVARSVLVDFTGTAPQRDDNFNAPPAVTRAAVLYVFRCLVGQDIPLNDGCLRPITIVIPPGTFLSPDPGHAVVAGNTEVSQAVCNALFLALGALACSQGTMNNFVFGDATRQYYETICGGAGAGAGFDGASAVHTHMTNTRMTDPEVLELRYPVRVERFAIRRGSGGAGARHGGDGAIRHLRFLEPMTAVLLSSRRTRPPLGLEGGGSGAPGRQWIERADGQVEALSGICRVEVKPGDSIVIETPGGGGFGRLSENEQG